LQEKQKRLVQPRQALEGLPVKSLFDFNGRTETSRGARRWRWTKNPGKACAFPGFFRLEVSLMARPSLIRVLNRMKKPFIFNLEAFFFNFGLFIFNFLQFIFNFPCFIFNLSK
jgi:hypothetical protein